MRRHVDVIMMNWTESKLLFSFLSTWLSSSGVFHGPRWYLEFQISKSDSRKQSNWGMKGLNSKLDFTRNFFLKFSFLCLFMSCILNKYFLYMLYWLELGQVVTPKWNGGWERWLLLRVASCSLKVRVFTSKHL